ncbi:hypothetical protein V5F59_05750 [Xanthobacter autotrophicus DSM 431]|uniref:hypothetical protein n=1 Tax=Xanthobacter nonsaccharivorans TaxID=3119912 RepID=UPI0037281391
MRVNHLPAAVLTEDDPRAGEAARVVPRGAKAVKFGAVVLGYTKPAHKSRRGDLRPLRLAELRRIIRNRHGAGGADTDDASIYLAFAAHHLPDAPAIRTFARRFTPGVLADELEEVIDAALAKSRRFTADAAAKALGVRRAERDHLGLRTIGATDHGAAARATERKRKNRDAKRATRAAMPKRETITDAEPWKAAGISRATWYRRQQAAPMTRETKSVRSRYRENGTADAICLTRRKPPYPAPTIRLPHVPAAVLLGERVRALTARLARITTPLLNIAPDLRRLGRAATIINLRDYPHDHP